MKKRGKKEKSTNFVVINQTSTRFFIRYTPPNVRYNMQAAVTHMYTTFPRQNNLQVHNYYFN